MPTNLHEITRERLASSRAWHTIRQNKLKKNGEPNEAFSCRQAITVRDRLGSGETGGIPLWAELKSEVGIAKCQETDQTRLYAAHTRGNTKSNRALLAEALELNPLTCKFIQLDEEESAAGKSESEIFGLVNPYNIDVLFELKGYTVEKEDIWQLLDDSIFRDGGYPNTLMTNCGRRDMALEIRASGLFRSLANQFPITKRCSFSDFDPIWLGQSGKFIKNEWLKFPPPKGPKIGVLTGNSPESGITLVNEFMQQFRLLFENNATDVSMPEFHLHSSPAMGLTMEIIEREDRVWYLIEQDIRQLLEAGCKLITIPCNTTIYFAPRIRELCDDYQAEFLSIAEACVPKLEVGNQSQVGLIGIEPVVAFEKGFSGYHHELASTGLEIIPCNGETLAWEVKNRGEGIRGQNQTYQAFEKLIAKQFADVETIILALTEISLVYRENFKRIRKKFPDKVFMDPLYELSNFILFRYLALGLRNSKVCSIPSGFPVEEGMREFIFQK